MTFETAEFVQVFAAVPTTVYDEELPGLTEIFVPVCEVLQEYVEPPFAVNDAACPTQIVAEFTPIVGTERTVTVAVVLFLQPFASVPVTVYVVFDPGETLMLDPFAPVLHE